MTGPLVDPVMPAKAPTPAKLSASGHIRADGPFVLVTVPSRVMNAIAPDELQEMIDVLSDMRDGLKRALVASINMRNAAIALENAFRDQDEERG